MMEWKRRLFTFTIWWAVLGSAVWLGGTVFMMFVIDPQWTKNPESLRNFFINTEFNHYIWYFFGPPFMILRSITPQVWSLIFSWKSTMHRKYMIMSLSATVITVALTLFYIYPINEVLMTQAGGNYSDERLHEMITTWVIADRIRFIINLVGFYFLLSAFRLPMANLSVESPLPLSKYGPGSSASLS